MLTASEQTLIEDALASYLNKFITKKNQGMIDEVRPLIISIWEKLELEHSLNPKGWKPRAS